MGSGSERPDFGLDAPRVVAFYTAVAVIGAALTVAGATTVSGLFVPGVILLIIGVMTAGLMVRSSRHGKIVMRDRVLDSLGFTGSEHILDLGCGRGLMLLGAAQRAPRGTATGIDLWLTADQAGSSAEACMANARILGVAERVRLYDGDMSDLPFENASFDMVLACLAIHNVHDKDKRRRVITEAARVLRPSGRLAIIDFARTGEYAATAKAAGMSAVQRSSLSFVMYPPVRVVTAARSQ